MTATLRPLVKWPGGKARLVPLLRSHFPADIASRTQYVEPFLGGGALFLSLLGEQAFSRYLVSDINDRLMALYATVRDEPAGVVSTLEFWQAVYAGQTSERRAEDYRLRRERFNARTSGPVEQAALFLYLNRTCFNGLYRENHSGGFNAPFGRPEKPRLLDRENLQAVGSALRSDGVTLRTASFLDLEDSVEDGAFLFSDSPYVPLRSEVGYTTYKLDAFGSEDQVALRDFLVRLGDRGVKWLMSNSDPHNTDPEDDTLDELYAGFNIRRIEAGRSIGAAAGTRGKVSEILVSNYSA